MKAPASSGSDAGVFRFCSEKSRDARRLRRILYYYGMLRTDSIQAVILCISITCILKIIEI